jgi:hypothetical protein
MVDYFVISFTTLARGLGHLLDRCGGDLDVVPDFSWNVELSPGEAQRLCFARLFFQRPNVAILVPTLLNVSFFVPKVVFTLQRKSL